MTIPRLVLSAASNLDVSRVLARGAVRNAAAAVERDRAGAEARRDAAQAVERANLATALMRSAANF